MKKISFPAPVLKLIISAILLSFAPIVSFAIVPPAPPELAAKSWILMDYNSGKVLAESQADTPLDPASLTKMMSSYVIGQAIKNKKINLTDIVTVTKEAWAMGNPKLKGSSLMFLKPGDKVSVADLNKGVAIVSGNDASIALADYVAGSQQAFISLMNNYAKLLGLKNTQFKTVHGLDTGGQYSTARDMALLGQALIRDVPEEYALNKEKYFTYNNIRQYNRNRLLWSTTLNVDGIKTGHTNGAGNNLVASATEGHQRLIAVVLGAATDAIRFRESEKLLTWGFRFWETIIPLKAGTVLSRQRVWYGEQREASLGVKQTTAITIPKGQRKNVKMQLTLTSSQLQAPLAQNQVVGVLNFELNGKIIEQRPLVVLEEVKESGFFSRIWDYLEMKLRNLFAKWFG